MLPDKHFSGAPEQQHSSKTVTTQGSRNADDSPELPFTSEKELSRESDFLSTGSQP